MRCDTTRCDESSFTSVNCKRIKKMRHFIRISMMQIVNDEPPRASLGRFEHIRRHCLWIPHDVDQMGAPLGDGAHRAQNLLMHLPSRLFRSDGNEQYSVDGISK